MVKNRLSNIKIKLTAVIVIIMALCFGFTALGCSKDESDYEYAMRIAKEEFGCERILWVAHADYRGELTSVYLLYSNEKGEYHDDFVFEQERSKLYVLGVDRIGREMFIVIPDQDSVERGFRYSPRLIQWPFSYSFTEIANFAAEYGYKYADGIEGREQEYFNNIFHDPFEAYDYEDKIRSMLKVCDERGEEAYDKLDVKFALAFRCIIDKDHVIDYFITQEDGTLKMYQIKGSELETIKNVITYERNKKTEE